MPMPDLNADGFLPPGTHDAGLEDIAETFGQSATRRALMNNLRRYVAEVRRWPLAQALLVDGSFVTNKQDPNDIDVALVLRGDYDLRRQVSPVEYNLRPTRLVKREYGLDLFAVRPNSLEYDRFVQLFSQVRNRPDLLKGMIRVPL
jgi:hypothetical protein